jgi:hypothetical protein
MPTTDKGCREWTHPAVPRPPGSAVLWMVVVVVVGALACAQAGVVTFTGNIAADFTGDYFSLLDGVDLLQTLGSGFDVREVVFAYDKVWKDRVHEPGHTLAWRVA